jgi:CRISPR-associated endoribonuclease Cas6
MTFTPDTLTNKATIAGLSLVLRPTPPSTYAVPLSKWLPNNALNPKWVSLVPQQGIIKAMPVLPQTHLYTSLLQVICQNLASANIIEWQERHYEVVGVETQTDCLFVIQLSVSPSKPLPPNLGRAVHALCLQWFANADTDLVALLHQAEPSPFTVAVKSISDRKLQIRISLLQQDLLAPLLYGLSVDLGQKISLTEIPCLLSHQVRIAASSRFEKLAQVLTQDPVELQFFTPTSFKQQQLIQTFPLPDCVFGSLLRRWNAFAPKNMQLNEVQWQGCVSAYNLKSQTYKIKSNEIGAQGWVRYRFPDSEQAAIATILAHFAFFAGVGRKTAMGMGQTQLVQRKPKH